MADGVDQQSNRAAVVGHQHVGVAIVVHIAEGCSAAHFGHLQRGAAAIGGILEAAVPQIEKEQLGLAQWKRIVGLPLRLDRLHGAVHDQGVETAVVVDVDPRRTEAGEISPFRPGIGMMASRLNVPVVPVRLVGVDRVLHHSWHMARPGPVLVNFGVPLRFEGDDYEGMARQVEAAVRGL